MANTYIKIYIHVVFAVKDRSACIPATAQKNIFGYIAGIINGIGHKTLEVGGTYDHIHAFFSYNPEIKLSDTLRTIKSCSSKFINEQRFIKCRFAWQRGYAAFSYSHSHINDVIKYIQNQPIHHQGISLDDEIKRLMERYEIEYDDRFRIQGVK